MGTVLWEMVMQVCMDYPGVPDYRTMETDEIMRFYEGIRHSTLKASAPRGK